MSGLGIDLLGDTLELIPYSLCVVDENGGIRYANATWKKHLEAVGLNPASLETKRSYFDLVSSVGDEKSVEFLDGLRAVLDGERDEFVLEHQCPLEPGRPWLLGYVKRITGHEVVVMHDPTGFQSLEAGLRHTEHQLREMLENVHLIAVTLDERGCITFANDFLLDLVGVSRDEMLGRDWFKTFVPGDAREEARGFFEQTLGGGAAPAHYESEIELPDGKRRLVRWSNTLLRDGGGTAIGSSSIGEDITELKETLGALSASEKRFESIFEHTMVGVASVGLDGRFVEVNERFSQITGYDRKDLVGQSSPNMTHPDDLAAELLEIDRLLRGEVASYTVEKRYVRSDGGVVWCKVVGSRMFDRGRLSGHVKVVEDITEQRAARSALESAATIHSAITTTSPDGYWKLDGDGRFLEVNDAYLAMIGYTREEMLRMSVSDVEVNESPAQVAAHIAGLKAKGFDRFETRHRRKDGGIVDVEVSVSIVPGGAIVVFVHDIGKRTRSEAILRLLHEVSEASNSPDADVGAFLRTIHGALSRIVRADDFFVATVDDDGSLTFPCFVDKNGVSPSPIEGGLSLTRWVMRTATPALVDRKLAGELTKAGEIDAVGPRFESWIGVPLKRADEVFGLIGLQSYDPRFPYTESDLELLDLVSRDIASALLRKRAAVALRESEERLRHLVLGLEAVFWEADVDPLRVTFVSEQAEKFIGYPVARWLGKIDFWVNLIHPDDRTRTVADFSAAIDSGENRVLDYRMRKADGSYVWVRDMVRVITDDLGRARKLLGLMVDNSAPKAAERALRDREEIYEGMFRNNNAIKLMIDPTSGAIVDANPAAEEFYGYTLDELVRMKISDLNEMDSSRLRETMDGIVSRPTTRLELRHRLADGSYRDVEIYTGPIPARGRELIFSIVTDLTDKKRAERLARHHREWLNAQVGALTLIAEAESLDVTLQYVATSIEALCPGALASVLMLDADGVTLRHAAAPSLPEDYCRQIDGVRSGEGVGSCGTAIARKGAVFVSDIQASPLWKDYVDLANAFGLRACWSSPIISGSGDALGTFAVYYREVREPSEQDLEIVGSAVWLARIAIERTRAEETLRQTRQHLVQVIEGSPLPILEIVLDGTVSLWNAAAVRVFGWTAEEVVGRPLVAVPEESASEFARIHDRLWAGESVNGIDFRFQHKDGTSRAITIHAAPVLDEHENVTAATMVVEDVTEARVREAIAFRLGTAIENAPDSCYVTDHNGVILQINPAVSRLTGYDAEELLGSTPRLFRSGRHGRSEYERLWKTILSGDVWRGRLWNRKKDGSLYHEDKTIAPVRDGSGRIIGFVSIGRDVTLQEQTEQRLRERQRLEAVGQLAGGIAHDFNNLLQVILSYLEFAREGAASSAPEVLADIEESRRAAHSAADLTRRLLAFSRRQVLDLRPVDVNATLSGILKMMRRVISETIALRFAPGTDLPAVLADPSQLEQVILNLCLNARDAMPGDGEIEITTTCEVLTEASEQTSTPARYVVISVRDNGSGIPLDVQSHIFEPFFTTKDQSKGSGLGLAMVYGIVRQHGGFVTFESWPGKGSCFRVAIPVLAGSGEVENDRPHDVTPARGSGTILVAEDEEAIRNVLERALHDAGYDVLTAADGVEAIDLFRANADRIRLVILDIVMPRAGGFEVQAEVRRLRPRTPVVFTTGYGADASFKENRAPGAELIYKPYEIPALLERVHKIIASRTDDVSEQ